MGDQPLRPDLDVICDWMEGTKCRQHAPANIAEAKELKQELWEAGYVIVPREPTEVQKRAAFGPIMYGGRDGPIHPDFIRQEAALVTYRAMIAAAEEPPGEKVSG